MKAKIFLSTLFCVSMMSCAQETPKVKHKTKKETTQNKNAKTKFANAVDPICKMKTDENTKVSAVYKNKTYGFCSDYCKDEFLKSPEKYAR